MTAPLDLDELLAQEEAEHAFAARRDARMRALWAEAEAALRADIGLVIELAEMASATARGERVIPTEARAARRLRQEGAQLSRH
ncbi:hypothetical protein FQ142_07930 [Microbacterium sp. ANT_H45B]|uniref:hypothetical protein n=1 Tax=Microbacterium sp. ANT_H45B TaxID=2597346 RepID=UPI0011EF9BEA|nr:hypothetical protein [Microbacterium sp. ANT_H45B]KAA0960803.1 hypothetical protein FQ142_07930 [Microbacterium sp. ANT_H45B]